MTLATDRTRPRLRANRPTKGQIARRRAAVLAAWRAMGGGAVSETPLIAAVRASAPEWADLPDHAIHNDLCHFRRIGLVPRPKEANRTRTSSGLGAGQPRLVDPGLSGGGRLRWADADEAARLATLARLGPIAVGLLSPPAPPAPRPVGRDVILRWVRCDKARRRRAARLVGAA